MSSPMSEAELLAKLREYGSLHDTLLNRCEVWFDVPDPAALSLLTAWRDAAVLAEREACLDVLAGLKGEGWCLADPDLTKFGQGYHRALERAAKNIRARNTEPEQHG